MTPNMVEITNPRYPVPTPNPGDGPHISLARPFIYLQTTHMNPLSWAIRVATRSPWPSHAGFCWDSEHAGVGWMYLSAQGGGVQIRPRDKGDLKLLLLDAPGCASACAWAIRQIGKRYDFGALFGMALDRDWHSSKRWFCSELVAAAFDATGNPLFNPSFQVSRITPRDILLSTQVTIVTEVLP